MNFLRTQFSRTLSRGWQHQRSAGELKMYIENLHQHVASVDLEVTL